MKSLLLLRILKLKQVRTCEFRQVQTSSAFLPWRAGVNYELIVRQSLATSLQGKMKWSLEAMKQFPNMLSWR